MIIQNYFLIVCFVLLVPGVVLAMDTKLDQCWILYGGNEQVGGAQEVYIPSQKEMVEEKINNSEQRFAALINEAREFFESRLQQNDCARLSTITQKLVALSELNDRYFKDLRSQVGRMNTAIATLRTNAEKDRKSIISLTAQVKAVAEQYSKNCDFLQKQINELRKANIQQNKQ